MSDSLIAQVKRLAEAQKKWGTTSCFILDANTNARFNVDFPALLAHLERTQAVVDAAREFMAADWFIDSEPMTAKELAHVGKLRVDLDAALEKEQANGK